MKYLNGTVSWCSCSDWKNGGIQEEIVELKSHSQEDEHSKRGTKAIINPVVGRMGLLEASHHDGRPSPPCSLENDDSPERASSSDFERDLCPVKPVLQATVVSKCLSLPLDNLYHMELTPRRFPEMTATIPDKNEPSALDRTENHTTQHS